MDQVPDDDSSEPTPLDSWWNWGRSKERARHLAMMRLATADGLPIRPNIKWYRKLAKERLASLRGSNPDARLANAQRAVAREAGYPSWGRLATAIKRRTKCADELREAISTRSEPQARAIISRDLGPVLDAGIRLRPDDLAWLRATASGSGVGEVVLAPLHDAVALYGHSRTLAGCLEALFNATADWEFAMDVVHERAERAKAKSDHAEEVKQLTEALGVLAWYDEPDFDDMIEGD